MGRLPVITVTYGLLLQCLFAVVWYNAKSWFLFLVNKMRSETMMLTFWSLLWPCVTKHDQRTVSSSLPSCKENIGFDNLFLFLLKPHAAGVRNRGNVPWLRALWMVAAGLRISHGSTPVSISHACTPLIHGQTNLKFHLCVVNTYACGSVISFEVWRVWHTCTLLVLLKQLRVNCDVSLLQNHLLGIKRPLIYFWQQQKQKKQQNISVNLVYFIYLFEYFLLIFAKLNLFKKNLNHDHSDFVDQDLESVKYLFRGLNHHPYRIYPIVSQAFQSVYTRIWQGPTATACERRKESIKKAKTSLGDAGLCNMMR
jgi:hypothetical protein